MDDDTGNSGPQQSQRTFPAGCTIGGIRRGKGERARWVYASLYGPDGLVLISATLDYICAQLLGARIGDQQP